jgi:hypothetical protein
MNIRYKIAVVAAAAFAVIGGGAAYAATAGGPPTVSSPGAEYAPGSVLYLCVNLVTEQIRAEVHTSTPGNCAAGEVQAPLVIPSPYPTAP